ncbi:hypothetical protein OC861_000280 [Tilletia horrida]|nr:hypothetical protein OC861_000280 [Tilletia horrida]
MCLRFWLCLASSPNGPDKGKPLSEKDRVAGPISIVGTQQQRQQQQQPSSPPPQQQQPRTRRISSSVQAAPAPAPAAQEESSYSSYSAQKEIPAAPTTPSTETQNLSRTPAQSIAAAALAGGGAQQPSYYHSSASPHQQQPSSRPKPGSASAGPPAPITSSTITASAAAGGPRTSTPSNRLLSPNSQRALSSLSATTSVTDDEFFNAEEGSITDFASNPSPQPRQQQLSSSSSEGYFGAALGAVTGAAAAAGSYLSSSINPSNKTPTLEHPPQQDSPYHHHHLKDQHPTTPSAGGPTDDILSKRAGASLDGSEELHSPNQPPVQMKHGSTTGSDAPYQFDEDGRALSDEASIMTDHSVTPETEVKLTFIPTRALKEAEVRITDDDIRDDLALVRSAMSLFLNSRMQEAEDICIQNADKRLYKAVGMALINTVKALLTFEPQDFINAINCNKHSMNIASLLRRKKGARKVIGNSQSNLRAMNLVQLHAELIFAECQVLKAVLGIFYAGDLLAMVRNALELRNSYFLHREMLKFVEWLDAEQEQATILASTRTNTRTIRVIDQDFRSGVYLGNGLSSLILSFLPTTVLKVMETFGFNGDRKLALDLFQRAGGWSRNKSLPTISTDEEGVRRPLCDISIMFYHLICSSYVPIPDVDIDMGDKILSWNLVRFPQGIFFLYFSARLYGTQALPEKAIEYYRNAIEAQREYKQLHHLCFWDLSLTYLATCDFARAYECYDVLSRESNWSKAIYQYSKAIMLYETGMNSADAHSRSPATIMRTVPKLTKRVAGRSIPFERFVAYKAKKFLANNNRAPLPGIEFSYLWHCIGQSPVFLLVSNSLARIDDLLDELSTYADPGAYGTGATEYYGALCVANFLRGVVLRFIAHPEAHTLVRLPADDTLAPVEEIERQAAESFATVLRHGSKLDAVDRYLIYFSHYEWGRLKACMGDDEGARKEFKLVLSGKPLEAKGKGTFPGSMKADYLLSSMCMVRSHAALETLRVAKGRSQSFFASDAGSLTNSSRPTRSESLMSSSPSGIRPPAVRSPGTRHSIIGSPNNSLQKTGTISSRHSATGSFSYEH